MHEPCYGVFPVMDDDVFDTTDFHITDIRDSSPKDGERCDSPIDAQTKSDESKIEDMQDTIQENVTMKTQKIPHLILMVAAKEIDGNCNTPFQFHRQAPARISTSPTLRRIRKSTTGHFMPVQEIFDIAKFPANREDSTLKVSEGHFFESAPWSQKSKASLSPNPCISPLVSSFSFPREDETCISQNTEESINNANISADSTQPRIHVDTEKSSEDLKDSQLDSSTTVKPQDANHCTSLHEYHQSRLFERRRSSVVLSFPGLEVFPGDLLVSDGASDYMYHSSFLPSADAKKTKWPFSKKGSQMKSKQKQISDLENCLSAIKIPDFSQYEFYHIKDKSWIEFLSMQSVENTEGHDKTCRQRQESIWELFTSECTYFLEHLLVLKMVFMNALKHLQSNEHLVDVNVNRLFSNLEDLNQESLNFATNLFNTIKNNELESFTANSLSLADLLTKYFKESICLCHQIYCLNYTSAIIYLETIKQRDDFAVYLKWCEQNEQCKRLHLQDLLVAPLHRFTRYPLLLKNMWKRSTDPNEKISIYSMKEKVESSIRDLEGKVKWLDNSQKFKQLQEVIAWPCLWERDKRFFVPEGLKHHFKETNVENILSSPSRHLLYEGRLVLTESTRVLDVYLFLFDDFLLITKIKRNKRKATIESNLMYPALHPGLQSVMKEGGYCKVLDQPIPLDRLIIKTIDQFHVTVYGLKNAFLIQHENRYQQCIAAFILQAQTESSKKSWMSQIETAISCYTEAHETKKVSILPTESAEI
ncbi:pleckstrin homology domain-containing family G member 7 [Bombina bombina]|uniref:pleckstrin homology domain-containing family G member 7 n=1 Tax=Bombina bombina TaxID=8345 RepID=UPI00235AD337|nr:pleckstrin homology domain-containing family G member 7 [Bombina bombina]